jgi:hypothetical protein
VIPIERVSFTNVALDSHFKFFAAPDKGLYIGKYTPRREGINRRCHLGRKYEKWKRRGENVKEEGRKRKEKVIKGKEKRKGEVKGSNKCKIGMN